MQTTETIDPGLGAPHAAPVDQLLTSLGIDPPSGLTTEDVEDRREHFGRNELAEPPRDPAWRRLAAQFVDVLNAVLLVAAVLSLVVSGDLKTPVVVLVVVVLNAVIGFVQENRAAASLDALRRMLVLEVRVRRNGRMVGVPAAELVPGDVVAVEAGDRIPADGRVVEAVQLEVEEAALTGESLPVTKTPEPVADDAPLADRTSMVFMQTTVTRGRGELVVTSTGMGTEIGRIAGMLRDAPSPETPLQRQLDHLAHSLAKLAGVIVALVAAIGLLRGQSFSDVILTAVALAVASIPEGLPAVTAVTLAIGVSRMAREGAIVKRLASVETLGSTTVICSDKTGTLTLNEMTAERLATRGSVFVVEGEGYAPTGTIVGCDDPAPFERTFATMALCSDATLSDASTPGGDADEWTLVGDPTEGALIVLAAKGGIDVDELRRRRPRIAEVPFDSARKFMATVHEVDNDMVDIFVKGGPDVVMERCRTVVDGEGTQPIAAVADDLASLNESMAAEGFRVLAVAERRVDRGTFDAADEPLELVGDLSLSALVGIVDPPRPEAATAIDEAQRAGIQVKMITGDHAATATAIGAQLGLGRPGGELETLTGAELDRLTNAELDEHLETTAVFARVSPEHKLRLVDALQRCGHTVSMTGDGVNDAPALNRADMGVAMGITGTEVTKDAATMVLADDNFTTIVTAVKRGRTIYDNIVKFVRFQLSTTVAFALVFLLASILDVASGAPFSPIAILWVNIIMDGPPAMALGLDPSDDTVMGRPPRPRDEPILTRPRWTAIALSAGVIAAGTLAVLVFAPGPEPILGEATVAGTMAFNTFVLYQFFNIHNVRGDRRSALHRLTLRNRHLWIALGGAASLQVAVTHAGPLQRLFDTTSISLGQWGVCLVVASTVLLAEELRKMWMRRSRSTVQVRMGPSCSPPEV